MFFVSSCNNLRDKPLLGTVRVPPPLQLTKIGRVQEKSQRMGEKKIHKEQSLQILRFIADFPFLQSCQTATVPEGDYLHKPLGLSPCASSDNMMTRDLCVAACCLQNSWRQNPSFQILNLWQDLGSDIFWYDLLSASNKTKQNKTAGASCGECCFS